MVTHLQPLSIPPHFDVHRVGEVWRVSYEERAKDAENWAKQQEIAPATADQTRIALLMIDVQNTFCIPDYELFVGGRSGRGAVEDNIRLCEFIYRNLGAITTIYPTLDTHAAMQIFHAIFWVDEAGKHPEPLTVIPLEDVTRGVWRVNPAIASSVAPHDPLSLQRYALHYVQTLAEGGKYPLIIWPYHSMLGGIGHALVSAVEEAVFFHSIARQSQAQFEIKGSNPLTENYSVLRPEILDNAEGQPIAHKNTAFIQKLLEYDAIIIAGQAKSHCVAWTIADLLSEILTQNPKLAEKVYVLEDCTSPVVVPGVVDFSDSADAAFKRFADAGMHLVQSTQPLESWPGIRL